MPEAEGLKLTIKGEDNIQPKFIETIKYEGKKQLITIDYPEFSAVCPFSGLPDIGKLIVEYIPSDRIIELKSLKYYLTSFREVGIYQENATDRIYTDLKKVLKPNSIKITTIYNVRGGMETTCVMGEIKK
ncbi:MAG: preQ(1) synthase [Candidatus Marinimicrobia bacterium]|nr:preQ(1) synthase [Candidatus Neomarinimicrobiota bacterium]